MLGGSEDDLCRPTRSKEPGFQLLDAEDWLIPPRLDIWTEREREPQKKRRLLRGGRERMHCTWPEQASALKVIFI